MNRILSRVLIAAAMFAIAGLNASECPAGDGRLLWTFDAGG